MSAMYNIDLNQKKFHIQIKSSEQAKIFDWKFINSKLGQEISADCMI